MRKYSVDGDWVVDHNGTRVAATGTEGGAESLAEMFNALATVPDPAILMERVRAVVEVYAAWEPGRSGLADLNEACKALAASLKGDK